MSNEMVIMSETTAKRKKEIKKCFKPRKFSHCFQLSHMGIYVCGKNYYFSLLELK